MKHIQITIRKLYISAREGVPYSDSLITHYASPTHINAEGGERKTHHLIVDLWLARLYFHWNTKPKVINQKQNHVV